MSQYQFYEFRAIDRSLGSAEMAALRSISTRARITPTGFVNSYDWGDFKGDPDKFMDWYFDLHLYLANWGSRHFAMRLPKRFVDEAELARCLAEDGESTQIRSTGDNLIIGIFRDELVVDDLEDGHGLLDGIAPLRAAALEGDLRFLYLPWLIGVEIGTVRDEAEEPLPGLAPLTPGLEALAEFLCLDGDLVAAAASAPATDIGSEPSRAEVARIVAELPEAAKMELLVRLHDGDPQVRTELRRYCRTRLRPSSAAKTPLRTAGDLRAIAARQAEERRLAEARRAEAERLRRQREAAAAQQARLNALAKRGEKAWMEVEALIMQRNARAYEQAVALLDDLCALALREGTDGEFARRLATLRRQHAAKRRFIERLDARFGSAPTLV